MKKLNWRMKKAGGGTGAMVGGIILSLGLITAAVMVAIQIAVVLNDNTGVFIDAAKNMFQ